MGRKISRCCFVKTSTLHLPWLSQLARQLKSAPESMTPAPEKMVADGCQFKFHE